jgi:hypothetical protein
VVTFFSPKSMEGIKQLHFGGVVVTKAGSPKKKLMGRTQFLLCLFVSVAFESTSPPPPQKKIKLRAMLHNFPAASACWGGGRGVVSRSE